VTNDIAMALRTPTQNAEEIKTRYACALTQLAGADETIKVPGVGDRAPGIFPERHWPRWSSPAMKSSLRWCSRNCAAVASRISFRRASC